MDRFDEKNTSSTDSIDVKEASKRTLELGQVAVLFSSTIILLNLYKGIPLSSVLMTAFTFTLTFILLLTKKGYLKYTKGSIVFVVNVFLIVITKAEGRECVSYFFFLPLLFAIPFTVEDNNNLKKELFLYLSFTAACFIVAIIWADDKSSWQIIPPETVEWKLYSNTGSAMVLAAIFSYFSIFFERKFAKELIEQRNKAENLNHELQTQSEKLQVQSEELQAQTEHLLFLNNELHEEREKADKANQAKSIFLASMSHEIRTPMNAVLGIASLLGDTALNSEQKEYVSIIHHSSDALLSVINDILDFSKIESGKMELEPHEFNLRKSIEDVFDMFAGKAGDKKLELIYTIDSRLPNFIVADGLRLRQVLVNLIGNAVKFTKQGEVFLKARLQNSTNESLTIYFEVSDTGIGIPENKLDLLFKAFSQVDTSTTRVYGGTGLGLAICERLVKLMQGSIGVKSKLGQGTTFGFSFKALPGIKMIKPLIPEFINFSGKRILLADDNLSTLQTLHSQFREWNLQVIPVSSSAQVLEFLASDTSFDALMVDISLRDSTAVELAKTVKQKHPDIKVILMNYPGNQTSKKYPGLFQFSINKPIKQHQLYLTLTSLFNKTYLDESFQTLDSSVKQTNLAEKFPLNILIVEDNLINQKLAVKILDRLGYAAEVAESGGEALEKLQKNKFELILMDVIMPEVDGAETTRIIRKSRLYQPYIVAVTANVMPEARQECLNAGMNEYISKPIDIQELIEVIEKAAKEINK